MLEGWNVVPKRDRAHADPFDELDAVAQGLQIGRVAEIGVVDSKGGQGIRGRQAHATLGAGELQAGRDPEEPGAE